MDIIRFVADLIEKGYAYECELRDVYPWKIPQLCYTIKLGRFGSASGRRRNSSYGNPVDFALWESCKPGEISWDSPWGPVVRVGYIECWSCRQILGDTIDIHGGEPIWSFRITPMKLPRQFRTKRASK